MLVNIIITTKWTKQMSVCDMAKRQCVTSETSETGIILVILIHFDYIYHILNRL